MLHACGPRGPCMGTLAHVARTVSVAPHSESESCSTAFAALAAWTRARSTAAASTLARSISSCAALRRRRQNLLRRSLQANGGRRHIGLNRSMAAAVRFLDSPWGHHPFPLRGAVMSVRVVSLTFVLLA